MAPVLTAITDRVYFVHTDLVNWTLVVGEVAGSDETGGGVMLIDAGFPGSRADVVDSLGQLGFAVADVRAILLTHAHIDHFGSAIWFAQTHGTPVYCHADEVGHSKREYLEQASPVDLASHLWQPKWLKWSVSIIGKGALTRVGIPTTAPLTEEIASQLPGAPKSIPTPGHTGGHCSYVVDGVLVSGDAMVTDHPLAPRPGPQLLPSLFNHDTNRCRRSLAALAMLDTEVLIPGHGPMWRGPIRAAVEQAQAALS
ncbi:MAG: MBL fold metallo-hydrolase [Actinomycetia bacterium]|nr:MBL fold metallo-hydrolase [Actinomycetes bacterium]